MTSKKTGVQICGYVVALAILATACSSDRSTQPELGEITLSDAQNRTIAQARSDGATDEQVAVLIEGWRSGSVSFEAYTESVDRSLRCMREAGVQIPSDDVVVYQGLKMRMYRYQTSDRSDLLDKATRCINMHSAVIEREYQVQAASIEAKEAHFAQYRDALLGCLASNGITTDAQMSRDEILRAAGDVMEQGVDCLASTGFDG